MPVAPQPLEYSDALLSGAAGPSACGAGESPLAKAAAHRMVQTLRGRHRPLDIIAFGGSVTHGDIWQGVINGSVFPRVLASQLVERGLARSVRVRNLAIGATHGAAPMALCCDTLISMWKAAPGRREAVSSSPSFKQASSTNPSSGRPPASGASASLRFCLQASLTARVFPHRLIYEGSAIRTLDMAQDSPNPSLNPSTSPSPQARAQP